MPIDKFKIIDQSDLDRTVWRYLTFSKYISLFTYRALWFSKLNILEDKFEGHMPARADAEMREQHERFSAKLHPSLREQLKNANQRNVHDGRELTVVNCWFLDELESNKMWDEYAKASEVPEGVAIRSNVRSLTENVYCDPQFTQIGKVQYVDFRTHSMSSYEANQAQERAFLKGPEFQTEQEIRIATMSLRGPMCVSMDGDPLKPKDWQGVGMNNFDNEGLYIRTDLSRLGSGLIDHSQKMTTAAMQIADMKVWAHRS